MKQLYGYDLDGTLCESCPPRDKPYSQQSGTERKLYEQVRQGHMFNARVLLSPKRPFVIITGRSKKKSQAITWLWLKMNKLYPQAVFFLEAPRTRPNMIAHKVGWCQTMGITKFFEDDPKIVSAMRKAGINVEHIKHDRPKEGLHKHSAATA